MDTEIPPKIRDAALLIENWMKCQGHTKWKLLGIQNREDETTDTERLNWLISNGFTPARWRSWTPMDQKKPEENGMIYVGSGGRDEIDAAMMRSKEAKRFYGSIKV